MRVICFYQKSNDASIDMPDDYEHHLAAVLIQRIARGRIGSNEAHRVAASEEPYHSEVACMTKV